MSDLVWDRSFYRNGQVHHEKPLRDGQLHGLVRTWHKNGVLASEESYREGKRHGTCRQWSVTGKLLGTSVQNEGTGTYREWWDNGQLKLEISILDGDFHGISRQWLMDGTLAFKAYFVNGGQITPDQYQEASTINSELPKNEDDEPVQANAPGIALKEHNLFVQSLLQQPNKAELRKWLSETETHGNRRLLGGFPEESQALEFAEGLYRNNAVSVIAADLYSNYEGDEFCDILMIELPHSLMERAAFRLFFKSTLGYHSGYIIQPDNDIAESHLLLAFP